MSALRPTRTRLALADAIEAGAIRHYPFVEPFTVNARTDKRETRDVAELVKHKLAELCDPEDGHNWQPVRLTDAGRAWRDAARAEV